MTARRRFSPREHVAIMASHWGPLCRLHQTFSEKERSPCLPHCSTSIATVYHFPTIETAAGGKGEGGKRRSASAPVGFSRGGIFHLRQPPFEPRRPPPQDLLARYMPCDISQPDSIVARIRDRATVFTITKKEGNASGKTTRSSPEKTCIGLKVSNAPTPDRRISSRLSL
ncbi:hypothetical protein PUN28_017281 [Cardiocondyla obscurior]|uniref:Uncharacterized protein n=1 Tax=Cardiocondyla obscurior TaxID=286306 RepID=A0AAW2EPT7_9HYME